MADAPPSPFRILSLDGGGAKGFYTLGVLKEIEALAGRPLHDVFDLIYGTSTGSIIAALLALGRSVGEVHALYEEHVVKVVAQGSPAAKTAALERLAREVFGDVRFDAARTGLGVVTTRWSSERPMIFKVCPDQAHGRKASFTPGFGVPVGEAVVASCSAFPFFNKKVLTTAPTGAAGDTIELIDGGYCANNPTLYAIADARAAMDLAPENLRVISVGVGVYPEPKTGFFSVKKWTGKLLSVQLLQKTLEINTKSMDQLRQILFKQVPTVRISDTFTQPELATDLFESDLTKLNLLRQQGAQSFAAHELEIARLIGNT